MSSEEGRKAHATTVTTSWEELGLTQRRLPVGYNAPLRSSCVHPTKPTAMNKAVLVGE